MPSTNGASADASEGAFDCEVPLSKLLACSQTAPLPPPLAAPPELPCGELSPPVFERLVAEVVWRVDGMNGIRIYGRSGQGQGGLDLQGRRGSDRSVYQVRRVGNLTPVALRKAVQDFAGPSRSRTPEQEWSQRRFNAERFVLVTGCVVNDRHVEDELARLQDEYTSDLEIELYDNGQLSRMLRDRGSLVSGIFGPEWARAFCGYDSPAAPTTPSGRALLNDPVEILGYGELLVCAESLLTNEAAAAAELYAELSRRMDEKAFFPRAEQLRALQRDAHEAAGNTAAAFEVTMRLLLDRYDAGQHLSSETARAEALAEALGSPATDVARVGAALTDWFEHGYDLAPVTTALEAIVAAADPLAGRLVLAVAEQIVTDDDSAADPEPLCTVASNLVDRLAGTLRTRLECCIADLNCANRDRSHHRVR